MPANRTRRRIQKKPSEKKKKQAGSQVKI